MDIQFSIEDYKLNVRASGILFKDNQILLHKVEGDEFWGLIGGKVKINETDNKKMIFKWFNKHELKNLNIKPGFINHEIENIPIHPKHIIHHDI